MAFTAGTGQQISDEQIKAFFASNPTTQQIAQASAQLGLSQDKIMSAMATAGYGGYDGSNNSIQIGNAINSYVNNPSNGYGWGDGGAVVSAPVAAPAPAAAKAAGIQPLTKQQISDYWNANKSDPKKIYDAMMGTGASYKDVADVAGMSTYQLNQYLLGAQMSDISHPYTLNYRGVPVNSLGQEITGDPDWQNKIDLRQNDPNFGYYEKNGGRSRATDPFAVDYSQSQYNNLGGYAIRPGDNSLNGTQTQYTGAANQDWGSWQQTSYQQTQRPYIGGTYGGNPGDWGGYWDFSNGRGFPVGQYAYGNNGAQNFTTPTQASVAQRRGYGSWPSTVSPSQSGTGAQNPTDSMYGDFSNGW